MSITKNYAQLEFGTGLFFEYSGTEKEGYEKHTSTKGNISYRKYYKDGISGVLESVSLFDGKFGQQLSMNIKNGDNVYYVPVDLYDQKGSVDNNFAESLIKLLPNLKKGQNLTVKGYNFTPEGEKYAKIGLSITADGGKLKSALTNSYYKDGALVEGDVPALVWVEKLGKKKPSAVSVEAKDDYLLKVVQEQTERLKWVSGESSNINHTPSTPPKPKQEEFKGVGTQYETDDLPF